MKKTHMIESKYSTRIQRDSKLDARYLEDFPIALVALFNAVETSCDDFEQIEPWYSLSHALALKFFRHLSTVQHLCVPKIDATTGDTAVDHSSIISVSRAAYETFLIFSHTQNQAVIELDEPIKRGDGFITSLTVRKPKAGALRGISLIELANLNVSALQIVLPRITEPTLTAHDVANMDPAALLTVGAEVADFLVSKADRHTVHGRARLLA